MDSLDVEVSSVRKPLSEGDWAAELTSEEIAHIQRGSAAARDGHVVDEATFDAWLAAVDLDPDAPTPAPMETS